MLDFITSRGKHLPTKANTSKASASATESIFPSLPRSFSSSQAAALAITNLRWGLEHAREIRAVSLLKKEAEKLILPGWLQTNWEKLLARAALQGRKLSERRLAGGGARCHTRNFTLIAKIICCSNPAQ